MSHKGSAIFSDEISLWTTEWMLHSHCIHESTNPSQLYSATVKQKQTIMLCQNFTYLRSHWMNHKCWCKWAVCVILWLHSKNGSVKNETPIQVPLKGCISQHIISASYLEECLILCTEWVRYMEGKCFHQHTHVRHKANSLCVAVIKWIYTSWIIILDIRT
jgi:hypothetical protein